MTFHSSDVIKMGLAALLTTLFFIWYNNHNKPGEGNVIIVKSQSAPISFDTAVMLRHMYIGDSIYRLRMRVDNNPANIQTFQGFLFDTTSLEAIIHHNASGKTPDKVIFYYGEDSPRTHPPAWHIIAYGVKGDTLLQTSSNPLLPPTIMDKANPCPPYCPTK